MYAIENVLRDIPNLTTKASAVSNSSPDIPSSSELVANLMEKYKKPVIKPRNNINFNSANKKYTFHRPVKSAALQFRTRQPIQQNAKDISDWLPNRKKAQISASTIAEIQTAMDELYKNNIQLRSTISDLQKSLHVKNTQNERLQSEAKMQEKTIKELKSRIQELKTTQNTEQLKQTDLLKSKIRELEMNVYQSNLDKQKLENQIIQDQRDSSELQLKYKKSVNNYQAVVDENTKLRKLFQVLNGSPLLANLK